MRKRDSFGPWTPSRTTCPCLMTKNHGKSKGDSLLVPRLIDCLSALLSIMSERVYVDLNEKDDPLDKVTRELKANPTAKLLHVGVKRGLVRVKKVLEVLVQVQTHSPHLNFQLSLYDNGLESLSEEVCELMSQFNLVWLNLSLNKLKSLPASFSKLNKLKTLSLSYNKFRSIPLCVGL